MQGTEGFAGPGRPQAAGSRAPLCYGVAKRIRRIMIITSLLDTDLYKFSMMQVVAAPVSRGTGRVPLQVQDPGRGPAKSPTSTRSRAEGALHPSCQLRFTEAELQYLREAALSHQRLQRRLPGPEKLPKRCASTSARATS